VATAFISVQTIRKPTLSVDHPAHARGDGREHCIGFAKEWNGENFSRGDMRLLRTRQDEEVHALVLDRLAWIPTGPR
jgi:hypothetical protein